jgi:Uma2 family endonuclease
MSSNLSPLIRPGKIVLTYDDYCALPNDRNRYEILDGELSVTPAPATIHQIIVGNLYNILSNHLRQTRGGRVLLAPTDVILASTTVVQPDLIFIANDRVSIMTDRAVEGAPTLAVEILSPTTQLNDRVAKAHLYAKYAVPHYWLIDPIQRTLESYEISGEQYTRNSSTGFQETFSPSLFPGLTFQIFELWA